MYPLGPIHSLGLMGPSGSMDLSGPIDDDPLGPTPINGFVCLIGLLHLMGPLGAI